MKTVTTNFMAGLLKLNCMLVSKLVSNLLCSKIKKKVLIVYQGNFIKIYNKYKEKRKKENI